MSFCLPDGGCVYRFPPAVQCWYERYVGVNSFFEGRKGWVFSRVAGPSGDRTLSFEGRKQVELHSACSISVTIFLGNYRDVNKIGRINFLRKHL